MRRWLLAALLGVCALPAHATEISQVRHAPRSFDPAHGEQAEVSFRLSAPAAQASLRIYDGRDLQIREIDLGALPAGEHRASWDGRDALGRVVPPEAYTYALVAAAPSGKTAHWDLATNTGGEAIEVHDVRWDPETGQVRYRIDEPARVRIRIGLKNDGPLLRTLIDWVPRSAGMHEEAWDGKDAAGVFELGRHEKLAFLVEAFALPSNTLLVTPLPDRVVLIDGLPQDAVRRAREDAPRHRMFDFARQPIERRRDFRVELAPVGDVKRTADGAPIVDGSIALQLRAGGDDLAAVLSERCEAVFFVDGQFVFEREIGFLPMTWTWTPTTSSPGTYYITANVRGYEGHFGITTLRVVVEAADNE